jgi:hypothetical protein
MTHIVTTLKAARLLILPKVRPLLASFMRQEYRLKILSDELGIPLNLIHYWVNRLINAGLIEISKEEVCQGKTRKYYRAVDSIFSIPSNLLSPSYAANDDFDWLVRLRAGIENTMPQLLGQGGLQIYMNKEGILNFVPLSENNYVWTLANKDSNTSVVLNTWTDALLLDFEDASNLQKELWIVFQKYITMNKATSKTKLKSYILHLGLTESSEKP